MPQWQPYPLSYDRVDVSPGLISSGNLLRMHSIALPQVVNKGVEQYQPQYQPLRDSISYRLPLELCTADHNPLRPMVPLIFHLLYSPPDKSVFHQLDYRDNMGDHAEGFAKVQVNNIHCSPHVP